ncbi:lamin tail domain-containing protein [Verrucomicrobiaceae bacterium 227]
MISLRTCLLSCLFFSITPIFANPIISEVMYRADLVLPEDVRDEWLEIHNPTSAAIVLTGYSFNKGISFTFPAVGIPAGGYLVVAADVAEFQANFPGVTNVVGPWIGTLSNSGETIALIDAAGGLVDEISYADEGDWATRARGPLDRNHEGWTWTAEHDGDGKSLELINPALSNKAGQNWSGSLANGGTPGASNSVAGSDIAPLIRDVQHRPKIPNSTDPIKVQARVTDEMFPTTATLFWRRDGAGPFTPAGMTAVDDQFSATIPPQADGVIIEFYVSASDGSNTRDWPAEVQGGGHLANALIQVDNKHDRSQSAVGGAQGVYRVIMTELERAELAQIGSNSNQSESNAEMNATFVSADGRGTEVRYLSSIRNRGASSRTGPPNNHLVKFRSDDKWNGVESVKFNARYVASQVAGAWLFQHLGIETDDGVGAQLRINNADLAESGGPRMFGSYVMLEQFDNDWTAAHYPADGNGNLYQIRDDEITGDQGDLRYEGNDPDAYRNTYFKQTNGSADDWSDLIALTDALNNSPAATYFDDVSQVVDIDQWVRYLAVDALMGNQEGGLTSAKGDDYALYSGVSDPRFKLVPHDLDTLMGGGNVGPQVNRSVFVYDGLNGLNEFLNHPDIVPLYYKAFLDLIATRFNSAELDPILDRAIGGFVTTVELNNYKVFIPARIAGVLAQIPQTFSATTNLPLSAEGYHETLTGGVTFSGDFHAADTRSILVNGFPATLNARAGTWTFQVGAGGDGVIKPGLNRVVVQFYSEKSGAGEVLHREELAVWNNTGTMTAVSGTLTGGAAQGSLNITARDTYLPGTPFLVRVDFRKLDGTFDRKLWETTANLSASAAGVSLSPNTIDIRNGVGTALVTVGGGAGGASVTLLNEGSPWKYLGDGSNQGTAWRAPAFNDTAWSSGPAQLGYGDGDEATEVPFAGGNNNKNATTYFRTTFNVADASAITGLTFNLTYDDGAAIYLNGVEVGLTSNMTSNMAFNEFSDGDSPGDDASATFNVSSAQLVTGVNTLAVEIKQGDGNSSDISFDLEVIGQTAGAGSDPGDFTLTANAAGQSDSVSMVSLGTTPMITDVSGTLGGGASTTWSGVMRITDDVTVPAGHTLNIEPGTLILIVGDATSQSTTGKDLIIQGTINSLGTEQEPVTFTAVDPAASWGQILFSESEGATFTWTNIHRGGHSPRGGHTNHGRVIYVLGSDVSFEDCNITDNRGKVGQTGAQGGSNSSMVFRRCHWARSVTGIEAFDTDVLVEDCHITDMLGIYREDGITDDNDAIYLHGAAAGQNIILRRLVVAYVDDDGIDTLNANVTMEDVISRNCFDKGTSLFSNNITITRGLFVDNDLGVSAKDDANVTLDFVTIANNSTFGIQAENKDGNDQPSFFTISNSIIQGTDPIGTDYDIADITARYSNIGEAWTGVGNLNADPLFVNNYQLGAGSPAVDAADPALPNDPDGSRQEMGYYPAGANAGGSEVRWSAASGPYHVTGDVTIPDGTTFVIEPGTSVYFDLDTQITVNGKAQIVGTPEMRIQFSPVPGAPFVSDPAGNGSLPDGPPKWDGIRIIDSMDPDNRIAHIDVGHAQDTNGSIGIIRSQCVVDDVSFHGTHIRIFYTEDSSIILENSRFPDVFGPTEQADALGLDNVSEQVKGVGAPPIGGRYIIRNNSFGTTKGHNDVIDVDSGRLPDPIVQIIGNTFRQTGDEHIDLGGDAYVAGNVFHRVFKDDETSDRGYANGISTGDAGSGTTIAVARNIFWDVDHAINLKRDTSTIFENNSIYKIHPDFDDRFDNPSVGGVINLFIPTDIGPTPGDGAYLDSNIFVDLPRFFSGADLPGARVTPLEVHRTLYDPAMSDTSIGPNHPGQSVDQLGVENLAALPRYSDPENGDFSLLPGSAAIGVGRFGEDLGALVSDQIFITGEPPAVTSSGDAILRVGGPGIFSYRWRLNGGAWSADLPIGDGFDPAGTVREAQIILTGLADGKYTVEVEGYNFAGSRQTLPTVSETWSVNASLPGSVRLNEILAVNSSGDDTIELFNPGTSSFVLDGMSISDDPAAPQKYLFPAGSSITPGGFLLVTATQLGFTLDRSGETVTLSDSLGAVIDSVTYGSQLEDFSISRLGHNGGWGLSQITLGAANLSAKTGNPATLVISEWFANGKVAFDDDFIELYNPDPLPVPLAGLYLSDNANSNAALFQIPALSYAPGSGFVTFDSKQLGFKIGATMDTLALLSSDLQALDRIVFGQQVADYSQLADGSYQVLPTPGLPTGGSVEYDRVLAIYKALRITEIMFNPAGSDEGLEFIELQNTGTTSIDLTGVRFSNGIDFTFPAMILAPGDYVVLSPDLVKFEDRYGSGINVVGPYSGKLSNSGEAILLQLPQPYDTGILRFDYRDDWYPGTDGDGFSLTLVNPEARPETWGDSDSWTTGAFGGTPGGNSVLNAGPDQIVTLPGTVSLSANLNPSAAGFSLTWSQVSGPGVANFSQPSSLATGVSFSDAGTYLLAIEARGNGSHTGDAITITVNDTYEAWAVRHGAGLPEGDDDLDGFQNLFEYALDLDPAVSNPGSLPVVPVGSDFVFSYTRSLRKIDLIYQAQNSADLSEWNPASVVTLPGASVDRELIEAPAPANAEINFWRLLIKKQ